VCDWVQYKQNFREPVDVRTIEPSALAAAARTRRNGSGDNGATAEHEAYEIAVDLRRAGSVDLNVEFARALTPGSDGSATQPCRQYLEEWGPGSASCIWGFNALYWNALGLWEEATGREYEQALPGGESDARNVAAAREVILELFRIWDGLAARHALPEDLHVLELGVGNGNQARVWLDEFLRLDRGHHGEYYRRLHYLMGDYSQHVLDRARANVSRHADHVSALVLDATKPADTLGFLRSKAFLIYISNVYDNLPTDEIVRLGGHLFRVDVRAYLPAPAAAQIAAGLHVAPDELPDLVSRLLQLGSPKPPSIVSQVVRLPWSSSGAPCGRRYD
jgi:hypothetical protein